MHPVGGRAGVSRVAAAVAVVAVLVVAGGYAFLREGSNHPCPDLYRRPASPSLSRPPWTSSSRTSTTATSMAW